MKDDLKHKNLNDDRDNEVERNYIPMDVNISMKPSTGLQLQHKHISRHGKNDYSSDDHLVIDIDKLFRTPLMSSDDIPHQISPTIFKQRREMKISRMLRDPYTDPTKRNILRKEIREPSLSFNHLCSISKEAFEPFRKWMSQDRE